MEKICEICGKEFSFYKYRINTAKYCSFICRFKSQIGKKTNKKNNWWKGDKIGYSGIHSWLARHYGKANKCEVNKCLGGVRFEWALIKGKKYKRNRNFFKMLCSKCHSKYDNKCPAGWNKGIKVSPKEAIRLRTLTLGAIPWNKGIPMSEEQKRKISETKKKQFNIK